MGPSLASKAVLIAALLSTTGLFATSPAFFLGTDRSFGVSERPYINLEGPGNSSYDMRVYRIKEPDLFIREHLEKRLVVHREDEGRGNPIALLNHTWDIFKREFQGVARRELNVKTRVHLKISLGVDTTTVPSTRNISIPALLKDHTFLYSRTLPPENRYWDYRRIPLALNEAGFYLIEMVRGTDIAYTVVIKSDIQFLTKQSGDETLIFSANRESGSPVEGVKIAVYNSVTGERLREASASSRGIVYYRGESATKSLILAQKGGQYALSDPNFYAKSFYGEGGVKAFLYTDRPVYRPGDTVNFRGVVRNFQRDEYRIAAGGGSLDVQTEGGEAVIEGLPVSISGGTGTFSGEFRLPEGQDVYRGVYNIVLNYQNTRSSSEFNVESYKKPPFSVRVETKKRIYYAKEKIPVTVQARYYHGAPLTGAKVRSRVFRAPRYAFSPVGTIPFLSESMAYLGYGEMSPQREMVMEEEGVTDGEGRVKFTITPEDNERDYIYSVSTTVSDPSITLSGGTSFSVNRGLFYIDVRRENSLYSPGDTVKIEARLVPFDRTLSKEGMGQLISGRKVKARVYSRKFFGISGETKQSEIDEESTVSDQNGVALFAFKINENGHFYIEFEAEDTDGNDLTANTTLWVSAVSDSIAVPYKNLVMKTGRDIYNPGETAEVLIFSPVAEGTLFLSVEGNRLLKYEAVSLKGNAYKYRIPLRPEMTPNFSVSAVLFSGGEIYKNDIKVVVPPIEKFLNVKLNSDKKIYRPGENVLLTVQTESAGSRPIPAEVSVSVVDEAIYQIQPDRNPPIATFFYHPRRNNIQTTLSSAFRFFGYAETKRLKLALLDRTTSPLLSIKEEESVRGDFEDTAYWNARVATDRMGRATVSFRVPDNLTSWRVKAVAVTAATQVGEARTEFVSRKDLMVNPGLPSYLIRGKEQVIAAKITNLTEGSLDSTVRLTVQNASIAEGKPERSLSLKPGGSGSIYFRLKASEGRDLANVIVRMRVEGGGFSDSFEEKIPLRDFGVEKSQSLTMLLKEGDGGESVKFQPPGKIDPRAMRIHLSPGYGEGLRYSLSYLAGYPYGCIEQTMSRFMPLLAAKRAGYISPSLQRELPAMVQTGLDLIRRHQNSDGGFGWFGERSQSDPFMSAYVYRGLAIGKKLNQSMDGAVLNRARRFLYTALEKQDFSPLERAYILFSLSEGGAIEKSMADRLAELAGSQKPYGVALTALVLHAGGDVRAKKLFESALEKSGAARNPRIRFAGGTGPENDEVEFTATLLTAALRMDQPKRVVDQLSSALLYNRVSEGWNNSRDTAMAVLALSERMERIRDESGDTELTLSVDGKEIRRVRLTADTLHDAGSLLDIPSDSFTSRSAVSINKRGGPPLHAVARLDYFDASDSFQSESNGLSVKRTYRRVSSEGDISGSAQEFERGDLVMVSLEVQRSGGGDRYFIVEDPILPGFSFVKNDSNFYSDENPIEYDSRQIFDDRAAFFVSGPAQSFTIRYFITADLPGHYRALPARASLMYYPEVRGITADAELAVKE
jgi:uncharacterized protein YfaS (alpha-2-macroglobulin family)